MSDRNPQQENLHSQFKEEIEDLSSKFNDFCSADQKRNKFLTAFNKNLDFYKNIIPQKSGSQLPGIMSVLEKEIEKRPVNSKPTKFTKPENYYNKRRDIFFEDDDWEFIEEFKIISKGIFKDLTNPAAKISVAYIRKFIKLTVFLCGRYKYLLSIKNGEPVIIDLEKLKKTSPPLKEYYLFYNRSHVKKESIGIGLVTVLNDSEAAVEYYYREDGAALYSTLKTKGDIQYFDDARILMLHNLKDEKDIDEKFRKKKPVHSHFVLKEYKFNADKILLGINCSWNRENNYPYATSLILIEKDVYDAEYKGKEYAFDVIRNNLADTVVPPLIFYYLFHQSISLEFVINAHNIENKPIPFDKIQQIPFFENESDHIEKISGKYKGFTIIKKGGGSSPKDLVIISELEINANGKVRLFINDAQKSATKRQPSTTGFIKYINVDVNSNMGVVYMSLRYDYQAQVNSFNFYLEFKPNSRSNSRNTFTLTGCYAGKSLVTGKPIAAPVIFEEIKESIIPEEIVIDNSNPAFTEFILCHRNIVDFFLDNEYSNYLSVELLKKSFVTPGASKTNVYPYKVFISIPLTYNNDKKTYEKNAGMAMELMQELIAKFSFSPGEVYCACLFEGKPMNFEEYKGNNTGMRVFDKIRQIIQECSCIFFIYPKLLECKRISSSIIEMGYCLSLDAIKKIVILCDPEEKDNLPQNLMLQSPNKGLINFDSGTKDPIITLFKNEFVVNTIKEITGLK